MLVQICAEIHILLLWQVSSLYFGAFLFFVRFLPQALAIIAFNSIALVTGFNFLCHVWGIRF